MTEDLSGQIERITYTNEENGFTIAKVKVEGLRDTVTVVGNLMAPAPGEVLSMEGEWINHPKFGRQFKIIRFTTTVPATVYGIRKYLGSGLIKGIGPVMAERIVQKFGKDTLSVIEDDTGRLAEVEGIGKKRVAMIEKAWEDQREIRDVMIFLQTHGVGPGYAAKIFKRYGNRSIQVLRQNPFRLAGEIFGVGFLTADRIAEKLGFSKSSAMRIESGILYVLNQLAEDGHVFYPYPALVDKCREILEVEQDDVRNALGTIALEKKIVIEDLNETVDTGEEEDKAVYLATFHFCETRIAELINKLAKTAKSIRTVDPVKATEWVQNQLAIRLAEKQIDAIRCVLEQKVMVITGGPGTGKTTIIHAVLQIFARLNATVMLAAPTGRAAKRMSETTGHGAKTIHRLLEFSLQKGGFQRNENRSLNCDLLIIDEASMIDTVLMHHLMKAIPQRATFILVGDVNQLPSVGAGNILGDIIASGAVPVVQLNEIFRQSRKSQIIVNAHRINEGAMPMVPSGSPPVDRIDHTEVRRPGPSKTDFYFIQQETPEKILQIIMELVKVRIPRRFGLDPLDDIQVLTPMHKGALGAGNLNMELQKRLNPGEDELIRGARSFRVKDKVMQIRNNYEKEVFNGDIGRIQRVSLTDQEVVVRFYGRQVVYGFSDLDELVLAYAVSIHKSQGSEYPAVVIPIHTQHYILLQRNLIYTAVTRAKKLVVMVGTKKALAIGVRNDKMQKRFTFLKQRLQRF
jgi:exodeoxyribonuclease V alpha subunit